MQSGFQHALSVQMRAQSANQRVKPKIIGDAHPPERPCAALGVLKRGHALSHRLFEQHNAVKTQRGQLRHGLHVPRRLVGHNNIIEAAGRESLAHGSICAGLPGTDSANLRPVLRQYARVPGSDRPLPHHKRPFAGNCTCSDILVHICQRRTGFAIKLGVWLTPQTTECHGLIARAAKPATHPRDP